MAKRRQRKKDAAPEPVEQPFESAFAGLASLRDSLPVGQAATVTEAQPAADNGSTPPGKIVVRRERKGRKGKTVTCVSGFGSDSADWARRLKQELGCGGSVDGDEIVLAGDIGDRVAGWLQAEGIGKVVRGS